uniref:Odorant receptor n=1 Tax=Locusta migratoria TaxID=7004 RepID=A0A0M4IUE4_LOCMI|nr:odorant receptor 130 [Locusta migratoria]
MKPVGGGCGGLLGPGLTIRRLMGLWWPQGGRGRIAAAAAATLTVASLTMLVAFPALKLIMDTPSELEEITLCCFVIFLCSGFIIKSALFIYQGDILKELLQLFSDNRRIYSNDRNSEGIRQSYIKLSERVYVYMQVSVLPAVAGWVSAPMLARFFLTAESTQQFPVPLWFPGDIYQTPTYEILYAVQSFCVLVTGQCTVVIDVFFIHLMLMVAAELHVLNENISLMQKLNVKTRVSEAEEWQFRIRRNDEELTFPIHDHRARVGYFCSEDVSDENMCLKLVKNIQHHQQILRSVLLLKSVMNVSIFILLLLNMADLCSCMFITAVLLQRGGDVTKALKPLLTIPPLLYETGMYCFFGQILTDQSENLIDSAFSSGWVDCDSRFKRDLLIFLMAANRPLEVTVGKISKLSKQMLVQVLNGTYGLLNLLYHFHGSQ